MKPGDIVVVRKREEWMLYGGTKFVGYRAELVGFGERPGDVSRSAMIRMIEGPYAWMYSPWYIRPSSIHAPCIMEDT